MANTVNKWSTHETQFVLKLHIRYVFSFDISKETSNTAGKQRIHKLAAIYKRKLDYK